MEEKIFVTDDLIARYRARVELALGRGLWADSTLQGEVIALSTRLTIAVMAGWEHMVTDITAVLARCEPLQERTIDSYEGALLHIAYLHYCECDRQATHAAMAAAVQRFPTVEKFQRLRKLLESVR